MWKLHSLTTVLIVIISSCAASADAVRFDAMGPGVSELTLTGGYGENHKIPDTTDQRFQFTVAKFRRARFKSDRSQVGYEFALRRSEDAGGEWSVSSMICYRRYFLQRGHTALGLDLGIGLEMDKEIMNGQGSNLNFTERAGLTLQYGINENAALNLVYSYSHTSNAGLSDPNRGINTSSLSLGYSWYIW